jgi:hypothetical protein
MTFCLVFRMSHSQFDILCNILIFKFNLRVGRSSVVVVVDPGILYNVRIQDLYTLSHNTQHAVCDTICPYGSSRVLTFSDCVVNK